MITIKAPFLFTFLVVLIVVLIINFITWTYLVKRSSDKNEWKTFIIIVLIQSALITLLLNWL